MKFSTTIFITSLSVSTAFSPSVANKKDASTSSSTRSDASALASDAGIIYDPLGLYPKDAPEREHGMIQPLEVFVRPEGTIVDPLGLYRGQKDEVLAADMEVEMSASLPFLKRPEFLDGSLAGDRGFDPFNFANSRNALLKYRNSELKHARLAMLAAVGWPTAELYHETIANAWELPGALNLHDRVPSLLNGGLGNVSPIFWVSALAVAATIETLTGAVGEIQSANLGFDPLGLAKRGRERFMEESELFNGRLAMLAITGFAAQEWFTGNSVVDAIPILFKPLNIAVGELLMTGGGSSFSL